MRLLTFTTKDEARIGALVNENKVVDLNRAAVALLGLSGGTPLGADMREFLAAGEEAIATAQQVLARVDELFASRAEGTVFDLDAVTLRAPISNPQKIIAVGLNYQDHCEENDLEPPEHPILFAKLPSAIIGLDEPIVWPPEVTDQVDYEVEFAFVVGRKARCVSVEEAVDYVFGYTVLNDVSARDLQFADGQWVRAKSLDTFCPIGPYLVSKDEFPFPPQLDVSCKVNGRELQRSNTRHLIFGVAELLSFVSQACTLYPGDIISTGTPGGVGYYQEPQLFLKPGDTVTAEIEGLGRLTNPIGEWRGK
jgi:2-keto-4-pentenoate hydratase/2-oxohepta-3-ene-1,7-dioic acid hydratase in catechol pathway